jgi:hypothetical protein
VTDPIGPPPSAIEAPPLDETIEASVSVVESLDADDGAARVARQTRDAVLAGISRDLTRHLKLTLSDEQNVVLECQRDLRLRPKPVDVIRRLEEADRSRNVARRELIGALEAGWRTVPVEGDGPDPSLLDEVVDEVARVLFGSLHERLLTALADQGEGDNVAERVRNLYRETRNEQAGRVAEHAALAAFATGQYAAASRLPDHPASVTGGGGDAEAVHTVRVRWAFDGCLPDCYDNSLAGPLELGATFPTEHRHPPGFVGCRCLLIVERSEPEPVVDVEPAVDVEPGADADGTDAVAPAVEAAKTRDTDHVLAEHEFVTNGEGARGHLPATAV